MLCPGAPEKCCSVQWLILWKQGIPPLSFQTVQNKLRPYPWILSGKGGTGNKIFPLEKNEAIVHTPYIFWSIFSSFLIPSFLKLWFPGHTGRGLNEDGCKSHVPTLLKKKKKKKRNLLPPPTLNLQGVLVILFYRISLNNNSSGWT